MARKAERKGERKLPSSKPADLAPHLIGTKGKVDRPQAGTANEPLTFKVSAEFKRRFRVAAANRGIRLNELLVEAFEAWESTTGTA
jgi:hypothetical protein